MFPYRPRGAGSTRSCSQFTNGLHYLQTTYILFAITAAHIVFAINCPSIPSAPVIPCLVSVVITSAHIVSVIYSPSTPSAPHLSYAMFSLPHILFAIASLPLSVHYHQSSITNHPVLLIFCRGSNPHTPRSPNLQSATKPVCSHRLLQFRLW
jgi:hypothetical protein